VPQVTLCRFAGYRQAQLDRVEDLSTKNQGSLPRLGGPQAGGEGADGNVELLADGERHPPKIVKSKRGPSFQGPRLPSSDVYLLLPDHSSAKFAACRDCAAPFFTTGTFS